MLTACLRFAHWCRLMGGWHNLTTDVQRLLHHVGICRSHSSLTLSLSCSENNAGKVFGAQSSLLSDLQGVNYLISTFREKLKS